MDEAGPFIYADMHRPAGALKSFRKDVMAAASVVLTNLPEKVGQLVK
jgi:hypothetical protein